MTANIESIKRKIRALLAKATGTDNENEAAAFLAKANELLEQHQLDDWDAGAATESVSRDPVDREVVFAWIDATPSMNDHKLWTALLRMYGCRVINSHGRTVNGRGRWVKTTQLNAIGPMSARETAKLMFPFVMSQCKVAGQRLAAEGHGPASKMQLRVVNALLVRIYQLIAEQAKAAKTPVAQSRALVVVNAVDAKVAEEFGKVPQAKSRRITTTDAAKAAADKVSLHRQVSQGTGTLMLGNR